MTSKLFHRCVFLLLLLLVVELVPGADAKWWSNILRRGKDPDDPRSFVTGLGGELQIRRGDTVITGLWPSKRVISPPPYHWMYAVDNRGTVLLFLPKNIRKFFRNAKPVLIDVRKKYKNTQMQNRGKKKGHIGDVGSLVAALLYESVKQHNLKLHFDLLFCHCKHYVEYLSLGKVGGSWRKAMYHRMDKKCPLRAPLHSGLFHEIWKTKSFTLKDGNGGEVRLHVEEWPDYVRDVQKP